MAGFRLAPKAARARRNPWQRRRVVLSYAQAQSISVGVATEVDEAVTLSGIFGQDIAVGVATETDTAVQIQVGSASNTGAQGGLVYLFTANPSLLQTIAVGPAVETDVAMPVGTTNAQSVAVSPATEVDTAGVARVTVASTIVPGLWHLFKDGELLDDGVEFSSQWSGPYHTFGDPDLRKRVRRIHADGRGTVDVYVSTEYDSDDGDLVEAVDFGTGSSLFGGGGTFGGAGVFAGGITIGEDVIATPAPGVARAWSVTFRSDAGQYWELDAYTIRTQTRRD